MGSRAPSIFVLTSIWIVVCLFIAGTISGQNGAVTRKDEGVGVRFTNVAQQAGLNVSMIYGDEHRNRYLLETTGSGAAFIDYDNDGWQDVFLVNGTRLDGLPRNLNSTNRLFHNTGNGKFIDVTEKAGLLRTGWGQSVCSGDYDNDGYTDLFISSYGKNALYRNNRNSTFTELADKAGVANNRTRWGSGCAFLDYDRDGLLDLFVASYIDLDLRTAPLPETGPCQYKGITVACGPPGLAGGSNTLYRNNGNGTFSDVSEKSGITRANGTYGLGVLTADFDNDGWTDIYVANDSAPSALYRNNKNGTFTDIGIEAGCALSIDGKPQAGMGVTAGDYNRDGWLDIFKTNFSNDTSSLYRNTGKETFDDVTFSAGMGLNTRWLGWGCGFIDVDNDGWTDIFLVNGHVYPEVEKLTTEAGYAQPKVLYRNLQNGSFADVSQKAGEAVVNPNPSRGAAFGDYDNDGDVDILINSVNGPPELLRADSLNQNNWIKIKLAGVKSNRDGIGARIKCVTENGTQIDEVRSGGSYYSQNDLRIHFGLGKSQRVQSLEISWPGGKVETIRNVAANQLVIVKEGQGIVQTTTFKR